MTIRDFFCWLRKCFYQLKSCFCWSRIFFSVEKLFVCVGPEILQVPKAKTGQNIPLNHCFRPVGVRPNKKLFPRRLRKTVSDSVVPLSFGLGTPVALGPGKGPVGLRERRPRGARGAGAGSHPWVPTPLGTYPSRYPAPSVPTSLGTYPRGWGL